MPHRRARRARKGARLRRPRHNGPRRHVRGRKLLPRLPRRGHKAHNRLRGLRGPARAHGTRVRYRQPLHPSHPALQGRDGLQEPQLPRLHGLHRGLLREAAHRLAAPARAFRGPRLPLRLPRGRDTAADSFRAVRSREGEGPRAARDFRGRLLPRDTAPRHPRRGDRRGRAAAHTRRDGHPPRRHERRALYK